jgi:hypothetical protein
MQDDSVLQARLAYRQRVRMGTSDKKSEQNWTPLRSRLDAIHCHAIAMMQLERDRRHWRPTLMTDCSDVR